MVIAIIGVLVALLLPAVQAAREAARNAQCKNNLRQIGIACLNYETARKEFPTGGWGWRWMGDPNQGAGPRQPGGWIYQVAPFIEQANVTLLGKGLSGPALAAAGAQQRATVIDLFYCPSRRRPVALGPGTPGLGEFTYNADAPPADAKTDYAICGGTKVYDGVNGPNPNATMTDCLGGFPNCTTAWFFSPQVINEEWNGIVGQRIGAKIRQITDGTSNTILAGEKYLAPVFYETPTYESGTASNYGSDNPGDNSSMWQGYDKDTIRGAGGSFDDDGRPQGLLPLRDTAPRLEELKYAPSGDKSYGSPHTSTVNVVYADGSVHGHVFEVDPIVWGELGNRHNGG